ncbi:MAG: preprotein translocase subunit SecG [Clostridia bacterium]|nr:preprotein translocase subunit SecG [Clostridia bacterium]
MEVLQIIVGALVLLLSIVIILVVILQEGHRSGINGAISGGADTFLSKNKARTFDAFLARWTKWIAVGFFVLTIVANVIALAIKG